VTRWWTFLPAGPIEDQATAKSEMDEIKGRFREDRKVGGSSKRFDAMSAEEQLYYSTVMEADTRISVRSNSHPIRSHWFDDLYSCMIDLDFYYPGVKVG